jgi:cell pole-organizing protein PopZ
MGKNQAATQSKMEDLLASLRQAIEPADDGDHSQLASTGIHNDGVTPPGSRRDEGRSIVSASQAEEISNLRKRIAGNLGRESYSSGFATILGGRPPANAVLEPALLEDRSLEHALPVDMRTDAPAGLRQSVSDSSVADFAEPPVQTSNPEQRQWRSEFRAAPRAARPDAYAERGPSLDRSLMSDQSSAAANAAFNRLAETVMTRALGERSVEDLTRELLRTMLKQWLDDNLPELVERIVRDEIERVARRGQRR